MSGIAGLLLNWNPLMKLDGYYMLSEVLEIADLKESSTGYVSAWVKRHIWGLPVEVPYVPKRRRFGFAVYALLSGAYSYTVLYVLARFVGNVFRNFNPDWSFVPELATAALIFRSRIRALVNFMRFVYLDKKDRIRAWLGTRQALAVAVFVVLFLFLPLWHESALGRFALEPAHRAVVRNLVPGTVVAVFASEARRIEAGAPLLRLRNLALQSRVAESEAETTVAVMRANAALLQYANLGPTLEDRNRLVQQNHELESQSSYLVLSSPLSGTVLTPRLSDRIGAYVPAGTELVEIGDLSQMRARVYVSDHDFYKIQVGSPARLQMDGFSKKWDAQAMNIAPVSSEMGPGLADQAKYKGMNPPSFYLVDITMSNPQNELKVGMLGMARIYGQRRSLVGLMWQEIAHFFGRKIW
jgi:putative peptide zinc metalloprotease protein